MVLHPIQVCSIKAIKDRLERHIEMLSEKEEIDSWSGGSFMEKVNFINAILFSQLLNLDI